MTTDKTMPAIVAEANEPTSGSGQPSVLVIDDQAANLRMVCALLARAGFQAPAAGGGAEGLEMMLASRPDVVLLDMKMPGMDGFEVLRQMRDSEELKALPVIFLTA